MLKTEERNPNSMNIDKASTIEMLSIIQKENENAIKAVNNAIESIGKAVDVATEKIKSLHTFLKSMILSESLRMYESINRYPIPIPII